MKGVKVVVWSEEINAPKYVRYAWSDNPVKPNLFNRELLLHHPSEQTSDAGWQERMLGYVLPYKKIIGKREAYYGGGNQAAYLSPYRQQAFPHGSGDAVAPAICSMVRGAGCEQKASAG